jgi:hypothetical protein
MNVLVALLSLTAAAVAGDLNDDEHRYLSALIEARDARADQLRQGIALQTSTGPSAKRLRRNSKTAGAPSPNPTESQNRKVGPRDKRSGLSGKDPRVAQWKAELDKLESGAEVPELGGVGLLQQGSIGYLKTSWGETFEVTQVIGPTEMLIHINGLLARADGVGRESHLFWVQGFPTTKYADGQKIRFNELVINDGTKTYTNVTGAKSTVFSLRSLNIDRDKVLAEYRAQSKPVVVAKPAEEKKPAKTPSPEPPADPEAAARNKFAPLLANSRNLIKAHIYDAAEKNLNRIVKEAPGTAIAAEAQKELDQLAKRQ